MTKILILTDLHLSITKKENLNSYLIFIKVIKKILYRHQHVFQSIFILGDISSSGEICDYEFFSKIISRHYPNTNIHIICGNHDNKKAIDKVLGHYKYILLSEKKSILVKSTYFIFLKTQQFNTASGKVCRTSIKLIKKVLETTKNKIILLLHHHVLLIKSPIDNYNLLNSQEIIDLIECHPTRIEFIFTGHTHKYNKQTIQNTKIISLPSSFIQYDPTIEQQYYTILEFDYIKYKYNIYKI